jgi:probable phosphoglycerate mutase
MPLLFIRHGQTDWNASQRLQGQLDIPLNETGRRQAARNGRALAGILAGGRYRFVTSPLARARETMDIILATAGLSNPLVELDDRLREIAYGDWEGLTLVEVEGRDPVRARRRLDEKWDFAPPRGESYAILARRVAEWLATLKEPTLVVAHGGIMRVLLHLLNGLPQQEAPFLVAPQDRILVFKPGQVLTI